MESILTNVVTTKGQVRRVMRQGKEYLVAPASLIVPGVLNGSKGALFYPADEVAKNPAKWDNVPLTLRHPFDEQGQPVSAAHPGVLARQGIGFTSHSTVNGKLRSEAWFDVKRTATLDKRILDNLRDGKPIELSTGLFTENEPAPYGAAYQGKPYEYVARNYRPDHVAILPDEVGACSLQDGCGVLNSNPEGCNQYKGCEGGGGEKRGESQAKAALAAAKAAHARVQKADEYAPLNGKEHSEKALELSKEAAAATKSGDHAKAEDAHLSAFARHQTAARVFEREGYHKEAKAHQKASDAHSEAVDAHRGISRNTSNSTYNHASATLVGMEGNDPLTKGYPERCQHCKSPTGVNPVDGICIDCGRQNTVENQEAEPVAERTILGKIAALLGFNKDADKPSEIDPTAPAKPLGKGNWSLEKRANHAKALTESAEASSGAALENPSGHEAALKIHEDAMYAHIAAYEEARQPSSTKGEPDFSTAGYHKTKADYHQAKIRYHGSQALMHKNKIERGEAVAVNGGTKTTNGINVHYTLLDGKPLAQTTLNKKTKERKPTDLLEEDEEEKDETDNESYGYSGAINCYGPGMGTKNMAYNDAGGASTEAGMASMQTGHEGGLGHAVEAVGHSRSKDSKKAGKSHLAAAKEHEDEALRLRKDGYHDRAHEHDNAAAMHRKAASMHAATMNTETETPMTPEQREKIVTNLGCSCDSDKEHFRNLSDAALIRLAHNAKTKEAGADLDFSEGEEEEDVETSGDTHSFDGKPKKTKGKQAGGAGTPDEYNTNNTSAAMSFNTLPKEIQEDVRYARAMRNREKNALVERIVTVNAATEDGRKTLRPIYAQMDLGQLQTIAAALPVQPRDGFQELPPIFMGAAAPAANAAHHSPIEVTEDWPPTINWKKEQEEQRRTA